MNRWLARFLIGFSAVGAVVVLVLLLWPDKPPIPGAVKNEYTATILVPQGSDYKVNRSSAKYDASNTLLSYTLTMKGVGSITMTEQPTPDQFNDIPDYYSTALNQFGEYESIGGNVGTGYLIKPKNLNGKVAGVINAKGTLAFIHPVGTLSDDQWHQFFRDLNSIN